MSIQTLSMDDIHPYWKNPRTDQPVKEVMASVERYGYQAPIIVDTNNVIIAGHTRYRALRELGWTEIQVVVSDLDSEKAREYRIADNAIAELGDWDWDALTEELQAFDDLSALDAFFPGASLGDLVSSSAPGDEDTRTPTQADVEEAERREQDRGSPSAPPMYEVACPECGATFYIRPDLLERHEQIHDAKPT